MKQRGQILTHEQLLNLESVHDTSQQGIKMDALLADPSLMDPDQIANLMSYYSQGGGEALLLEDNSFLLMEDGGLFLLE